MMKTASDAADSAAPDRSTDIANLISPEERGDIRVLVVDDDEATVDNCARVLGRAGFQVKTCQKAEDAIRRLRRGKVDVLLVDKRMPDGDGFDVLEAREKHCPNCVAVMMTGYASARSNLEARRAGASDYITKPFTASQVLVSVSRAAYQARERQQSSFDQIGADGVIDEELPILGVSAAMKRVMRRASKVARTSASVFLTGESGTGKDLVARFIHKESRCADGPFVPINCAALPGELLESEMFGHKEGAFTGAVRDKKGLLEVADGGTVFLDELCEMPVELQPKLLRVLQSGEIRRLGSETQDTVVDVRVVSATNRDPQEAMESGALREDLYFRLGVIPIHIPPLRERPEDVPLLARHFCHQVAQEFLDADRSSPEFDSSAMEQLLDHPWPGNVRELKNVVKQAMVMAAPGEEISGEDLAEIWSDGNRGMADASWDLLSDLSVDHPYHSLKERVLGRFERRYLTALVQKTDGNISEAARRAEVDRTTLYRLMEKHDLEKDKLES